MKKTKQMLSLSYSDLQKLNGDVVKDILSNIITKEELNDAMVGHHDGFIFEAIEYKNYGDGRYGNSNLKKNIEELIIGNYEFDEENKEWDFIDGITIGYVLI